MNIKISLRELEMILDRLEYCMYEESSKYLADKWDETQSLIWLIEGFVDQEINRIKTEHMNVNIKGD